MIVDIGEIILNKINTLPFIDKYAGIVKTLQYREVKDGPIKMFPASVLLTLEECGTGRYKDLLPDASKKSVLFLEDGGTRPVRQQGYKQYFQANIDLVCWLNLAKLGYTGASYSGIAMKAILSKLPPAPFTDGIYNQVSIKVANIRDKNFNPYAKYLLQETTGQFAMYPYEQFSIQLTVDFMISTFCLTARAAGTADDCLKA